MLGSFNSQILDIQRNSCISLLLVDIEPFHDLALMPPAALYHISTDPAQI